MKPWWLYWAWRIFVLVDMPVMWSLILTVMFTHNLSCLRYMLWLSPLYLVATFAIMNALGFRFDYGVFGKYRRNPMPGGSPLRVLGNTCAESANSFFVFGNSKMIGCSWHLYEQGLGVKTTVGNVFLSLDEIDGIDLENGLDAPFYRSNTSSIFHSSPEMREPVYVPRWVADVMAEYYPEKVLATGWRSRR